MDHSRTAILQARPPAHPRIPETWGGPASWFSRPAHIRLGIRVGGHERRQW